MAVDSVGNLEGVRRKDSEVTRADKKHANKVQEAQAYNAKSPEKSEERSLNTRSAPQKRGVDALI